MFLYLFDRIEIKIKLFSFCREEGEIPGWPFLEKFYHYQDLIMSMADTIFIGMVIKK